MRFRHAPLLAVALAAFPGWLLAAPPEAPAELSAPADKVRELVVKVPDGKTLQYRAVGDRVAFREMKGSAPGESVFWLISETGGRSHIVWWFKGEDGSAVTDINKTVLPPTPPVPPGPNPPGPNPPVPPAPAPDALKTFRVIMVTETATRLTQAQFDVMYAKKVSDWLDANTTKDTDSVGWRRYDISTATGGSDKPAMNDLWASAKSNPALAHCTVVVERNGKFAVVPFEPTADAMIAKLNQLREGK